VSGVLFFLALGIFLKQFFFALALQALLQVLALALACATCKYA